MKAFTVKNWTIEDTIQVSKINGVYLLRFRYIGPDNCLFINPEVVDIRYSECTQKGRSYTTNFVNAPHPQKCLECNELYSPWEYDKSKGLWKRSHPNYGRKESGHDIYEVGLEGDPWSIRTLKIVRSTDQSEDALVLWDVDSTQVKIKPLTPDVELIWPPFNRYDNDQIVNQVLVVLKKNSKVVMVNVLINQHVGTVEWDGVELTVKNSYAIP